MEKITSETDETAIVRKIVNTMYTTGSNSRAEKSGNPETLIQSVLDEPSIRCVGLWKNLPSNFKALIDNKDLYKNMPEEDVKAVCKYLLSYVNTYSANHYFYLKSNIREEMKTYVETGTCANQKYVTNLRKYFNDTERKKCGGGGTKTGSNFSYDANDHVAQTKMLLGLCSR